MPTRWFDRYGRLVAIAGLILATAFASWPFAAPGHPLTFDVWPHLVRQTVVYQSLKAGFSPFYTFMFYSGYPVLRFYSPLFYLVGGLLGLLTAGNILLALRILLVAAQAGSGGAMYFFLRGRGEDGPAAGLGAMAYVLVPWRVRHVAVLANYPMALLYALVPLLFLALDRLDANRRLRTALVLGLLSAAALLTHIVYAFVAALFLGLGWLADSGRPRARVWHLALAAVAAVGVSAFFVVPFLAEYESHVYPTILMQSPAPDPLVLLGLKPASGGYAGGYFGLSILGLAIIGAAGLLFEKTPGRRRLSLLAVAALSLVLVFIAPLAGQRAGFATLGLLPERFLLFFSFAAAGLVASAYGFAKNHRLFNRRPWLAFAAVGVLLAVDCLPAQLRIRYHREDEFLACKPAVYGLIQSRHPAKVVDLAVPVDRVDEPVRFQAYPAMGFLFGGLSTPYGPQYHQFAPRSMAYVYPWLNQVAADLADSSSRVISGRSLKALALAGVSHVIMEPPLVKVEQAGAVYDAALVKDGIAWDTRFVEADRSPRIAFGATGVGLALAASRTVRWPATKLVRAGELFVAGDWAGLLDTLRIDPASASLNFIPVPAGRQAESLPKEPVLHILESELAHQHARLRVEVSADCFLRLSLSYYPWLMVKLDQHSVPFAETEDHFIYLRVPAGTHDIEVTAPLTPVRRASLVVSILSLLACAAGIAIYRETGYQNSNRS